MWVVKRCVSCSFDAALRREQEQIVAETIAQIQASTVSLSLGGCCLPDSDGAHVFDALKSNTSVQSLELCGNQFGAASIEVLASILRSNKSCIQTIDLDDNILGDEGAAKLAEALLTNLKVAIVSVHANCIGAVGGRGLASVLEVNNAITTMSLQENCIGDAGAVRFASALTKNQTLRTLSLAGNGITCDGASAIAKGLSSNRSLCHFSLAQNQVGNAGANALGLFLQENSTLLELHLEDNDISDEGASNLAWAIRLNCTLQELGMCKNRIGCAGVNSFANALFHNQSLQRLGFSLDEHEVRDAMVDMAAMRHHHTMRRAMSSIGNGEPRVSFCDTQLNSNDIRRIISAMQRNSTLRELSLENCCLDNKAAVHLARALKMNSLCSVEKLHLANNNISERGAEKLTNAFNTNPRLRLVELSGNPAAEDGSVVMLQRQRCSDDAVGHQQVGRQTCCGSSCSGDSDGCSETTIDLHYQSEFDAFDFDSDSSALGDMAPKSSRRPSCVDPVLVERDPNDDDEVPQADRNLRSELCGSPLRADHNLVALLALSGKEADADEELSHVALSQDLTSEPVIDVDTYVSAFSKTTTAAIPSIGSESPCAISVNRGDDNAFSLQQSRASLLSRLSPRSSPRLSPRSSPRLSPTLSPRSSPKWLPKLSPRAIFSNRNANDVSLRPRHADVVEDEDFEHDDEEMLRDSERDRDLSPATSVGAAFISSADANMGIEYGNQIEEARSFSSATDFEM